MKPVKINLAVKNRIWGKLSLCLFAVFVFVTFGITILNIYDYTANKKVIQTYETRLETINKRVKQQRINDHTKKFSATKEDKKSWQDLNYLKTVIKKNMFPVTEVLSQIEKVKLDKIDINELIFSNNLQTIVIKGVSNQVTQVSKFLMEMDKSHNFEIELSKEEIDDDKRIIFELTAKWVSIE